MEDKPTIRGVREKILNTLAADFTIENILEDYPELEEEDIKTALH
jgi:uncharacterized protein (DUF433 family)